MSSISLLSSRRRSAGFSLIELVVAMGIAGIIGTLVLAMFVSTRKTNQEQFKQGQQIENARYAVEFLSNDIKMAGYYGEFAALPPAPASLLDPCDVDAFAEGEVSDSTPDSPFGLYVQGYAPASLTTRPTVPTDCAALLNNATLSPGSDILVVRRLETRPLLESGTATASGSEVYAQTMNGRLSIQYGAGVAIDGTMNAKADPTGDFTRKFFPSDYPTTLSSSTAAYIRKVHVHVYFVASCRKSSNSDGTCATGDDTIPTLSRLELVAEGGVRKMKIVRLVEGIEFMKVRYGLDTESSIAGKTVDGAPDSLVAASNASMSTMANWQNVMTVELRFLARNSENTAGYTDTKTYDLGSGNYTPSGDAAKFKRHVFAAQTYIINAAGRREF